MISALTGELTAVAEQSIDLRAGPVVFSVLVPACDVIALQGRLGQELMLWTLMYLEGDASRGNLEPRVIGFLRKEDRAFFELFTTVKGIGPKTALKALTESIATISAWIESKDARSLTKLNGVGKRTAELVIAELSGKCGRFVGDAVVTASATPVETRRQGPQEDAIRALCNLGERRLDAEQLLARALRQHPDSAGDANELVRHMLRMRAAS
jgi:holliday junction DNA helicase RuvA